MKHLRLIILVCFGLLVITCESDDGETTDPDAALFPTDDPINFETDISLDTETVIALPPGSDISNLINLGQPEGESAAEFESIVRLDDVVLFGQPEGMLTGDTLFYEINFPINDDEGNEISQVDLIETYGAVPVSGINIDDIVGGENIELIFAPDDGAPLLSQIEIGGNVDDETIDLNFKYDIIC